MEHRREKTALIISALIHLILLMLFLFGAFKKSTPITFIPPDRKKSNKLMRQAALIPKRSDKGTKIFFDNSTILPAPQPTRPTQPERVLSKKNLSRKANVKPKTTLDKPIDIKKLVRKNITKKVTQEKKVVKKMVEKMVEKKPKRRESLLSLTKCFLDSEKGKSCMCRRGENRMPDFEEMKYICYEKQIQDQLIISWRALYSGRPPSMINRETRFTFVVNQHCKAEQVEIVVSSGNLTFDNMIVASVKSAVFPPIPKHFGVKKYRPRGGTIVLR